MGLDMYLYKEKYYGEYFNKHDRPDLPEFSDCECITISGQIGYWRKFNALHQWFVQNVQEGVDNCGRYWISKEYVLELRDLIKQLLDDPEKAEDLLPPQSGFFFGSTEVDEYYLDCMKETLNIFDKAIASSDEGYDIYYSSSW